MREILFRGKRKNGEWVIGYYTLWNEKHCIYDGVVYYTVIPETVGQYTGLTDKNGKKIFEGDILEHTVQPVILVNRGVVNWDIKNARWAMQLKTMNPSFSMFDHNSYEVIGNIHDNPELLKGEEM